MDRRTAARKAEEEARVRCHLHSPGVRPHTLTHENCTGRDVQVPQLGDALSQPGRRGSFLVYSDDLSLLNMLYML